jgi:hypothetical protein
MRAIRVLLLAVACVLGVGATVSAQVPENPAAAQVAGLRKELRRQRKVQDVLRTDLDTARTQLKELGRTVSDQAAELVSVRRDLAQTWGGGAVGLVILLIVLLLIAMRRPPGAANPDELQQRLAALDQKLRDLPRT